MGSLVGLTLFEGSLFVGYDGFISPGSTFPALKTMVYLRVGG